MPLRTSQRNRAFSLIELVIVVVIIAIIGAIAIPRMSRGAEGAADSALIANLSVLRSAIDLYETEHQGLWPEVGEFEEELTLYTDIAGNTSATNTSPFIYGPYLRKIPPLPVGNEKGSTAVAATAGANVGWVYTQSNGQIKAGTISETDSSGVAYNTY